MTIENAGILSNKIIQNVSKVMVGEEDRIKLVLAAMLAGGHVLIEDVPGTGKTMMAKAFTRSISGDFGRIQFTPDLMPTDVTGLNIYNRKNGEFELSKGPVFTDLLLADEINRATPRTQSSLLEAMEEKQVTIDGKTLMLSDTFTVIATENPLETIGTYPLPEAQLDRFVMKIRMGENDEKKELDILNRFISDNPIEELDSVCTMDEIREMKNAVKEVFVHQVIREYIVDIIMATRKDSKLKDGVSTRGTLALLKVSQAYAVITGSKFVDPEIVKHVAPYVLGHRIKAISGVWNYEQGEKTINEIVAAVNVPVENWEM